MILKLSAVAEVQSFWELALTMPRSTELCATVLPRIQDERLLKLATWTTTSDRPN
jgi:hypothetical protein